MRKQTLEGRAAAVNRGRDGERLAPLELAAWRGMLRAHADVVRRLDADLRARHGLSLTDYEALMLVGDAPRHRMRVSELGSATLLSVSGASRMVDRLAREGLVERAACEEDGRGAEVVLTAAGRERLRDARAAHLRGVRAAFLSRFDDDELAAMAAMWERLGEPGGR
ncbi:MarR family winged helix-turn-helix transcriptional regulator [Miltoncostaea marina]|uniref:MarR family winged helix-turn-helix transcriptional regulator n=1 Tax=Miltoncostaea marina TaxID=2843215 RepID=UPI001C3DCCBE|nr:MarR family transcriptional regulator [Miltoncostaea marina]